MQKYLYFSFMTMLVIVCAVLVRVSDLDTKNAKQTPTQNIQADLGILSQVGAYFLKKKTKVDQSISR